MILVRIPKAPASVFMFTCEHCVTASEERDPRTLLLDCRLDYLLIFCSILIMSLSVTNA